MEASAPLHVLPLREIAVVLLNRGESPRLTATLEYLSSAGVLFFRSPIDSYVALGPFGSLAMLTGLGKKYPNWSERSGLHGLGGPRWIGPKRNYMPRPAQFVLQA